MVRRLTARRNDIEYEAASAGAAERARGFVREMNAVDLVLISVLLLFALRGYWRGFFRELFGVLGLVVGALGATSFASEGAELAKNYLTLPAAVLTGVSFAVIFIVLHTMMNVVGVLLDRLAKMVFLRGVNRLAGAVFGAGKAAVITALILLGLHLLQLAPELDRQIMSSRIGQPMVRAAGNLVDAAQAKAQEET